MTTDDDARAARLDDDWIERAAERITEMLYVGPVGLPQNFNTDMCNVIRECCPTAELREENARLREALVEIRKGEGRFSVNDKQHAINTIEDMKALAAAALAAHQGTKTETCIEPASSPDDAK